VLASGGDLKIGAYEFFLFDDGSQPAYTYNPESLYSEEQGIQGLEGTKTANPNVLVWTIDDFAGGGETKYFSDIIPDVYWFGKCNPRIRGSVTSPPTQAQTTVTLTATSPTEWYTTKVQGNIWAGAGRDVFYSSDSGVTWTQHGPAALFAAGYNVNGMCHDGDKPWVSASNGTTRRVVRIDSTTASTTAVSDVTSAARTFGMAWLEGKVYLWTGGQLYEYDAQATLPITHRDITSNANPANKVYAPATATPTSFNAGIVASDTSVVFFTASGGQTLVYEYKYNAATNVFVGRKIWEPSEGFNATKIAYSMGVVYLLGDYGDQTALMGMSLINREPLFLSTVGLPYSSDVGGTLTPRALAGSYGSSVIGACDDGTTTYYFVYDAEIDSFSELDQRTIAADGTAYAVATVGKKRLSFANTASTTGRVNRWNQDLETPAGGWGLTTVAHHINFPYDEKVLFSIQVVQDPSITAGTIQVEYRIDEETGLEQIVTLTGFDGTDSFKLTYDGSESAAFVRGTNATAAAIQTALRTLTGDTGLTVSGTTDAGPFTVTFSDTVTPKVLSVTSPSGCTGSVSQEESWRNGGTTSAGVKYTNFAVSTGASTVKFRLLRLRLTGASGARLFNVTARAYINAYQETWRLRLRLDKESAGLNNRPSFRQVSAGTLRSYLQTLVNDRNVVTFLDGTISDFRSGTVDKGYQSKTVVVEFPKNSAGITTIKVGGQPPTFHHVAEVVLRSTAPN